MRRAIAVAAVMGLAAGLLRSEVPALKRYLKIRKM
jgi:hypothetical protein